MECDCCALRDGRDRGTFVEGGDPICMMWWGRVLTATYINRLLGTNPWREYQLRGSLVG